MINMKKQLNITFFIVVLFFTDFFIMAKILINETNIIKVLIEYTILFLILLLPYILCNKFKYKIPLITYLLYSLIVLLIYLGEVYDLYFKVSLLDDVIHSLSGISLVTLFFSLLIDNGYFKNNLIYACIFSFSLSLVTLYMWEIFEYINDLLFDSNMQKYMTENSTLLVGRDALKDTMNDLCEGFITSLLMMILCYFSIKYNSKKINLILIKKQNKY